MSIYIIAEIGPNHNGDLARAEQMVRELAKTGVDAVKFQISTPEAVYSLDSFKPQYQRDNEKSPTPIEMSRKHQLKCEDHLTLSKLCEELGIEYLCTAFDIDSLRYLNEVIDVPLFKVASGEIFSLDMQEYIAAQKKPVIMSTGMATFEEISRVLTFFDERSCRDVRLLHCVSKYPAPTKDMNLRAMVELKSTFGKTVGLSDHSIGVTCSVAAVALGAQIIEKHVTLDRNLPGPDHQASCEIKDFGRFVSVIREAEEALGLKIKTFSEAELEIRKAARKSIVTKRDISAGTILTREDVCFKRPGFGISPFEISKVIGKIAAVSIGADKVILPEQLK